AAGIVGRLESLKTEQKRSLGCLKLYKTRL
ncbi:MAG: hypothetical protein ACI89U_003380, partial [Gammaproteobacteria bacterium]